MATWRGECVEGGKIHGTTRNLRGRVLLNDLITPHESCHEEEISWAERFGRVTVRRATSQRRFCLPGTLVDETQLQLSLGCISE